MPPGSQTKIEPEPVLPLRLAAERQAMCVHCPGIVQSCSWIAFLDRIPRRGVSRPNCPWYIDCSGVSVSWMPLTVWWEDRSATVANAREHARLGKNTRFHTSGLCRADVSGRFS